MEPASWSVWHLPAALVPMNYVAHVQRAGGIALLIPPDPALVSDPERVLDRIDALMLVGGADLAADTYGAEPHPRNDIPIPLRDATEIALVRAAHARRMPVLGICRGAQVINVAAGGTLSQHLPDDLGHEEHRREIGRFDGNEHDVVVEPGSRALIATGETPHRVASHHHQAIDGLGEGLRVTARADDAVPEAIESTGDAWMLGVQWHPEPDPESRVIAALVDEARRNRREDVDREEGGGLLDPRRSP